VRLCLTEAEHIALLDKLAERREQAGRAGSAVRVIAALVAPPRY
jgi:hypothetical protein